MTPWTEAQVTDAAPDPSSINAARKLAVPGPWSETGCSDALLWGKCQGSGKTPYQVSVDLARPAYRCSCPSRKFPCKHALALMLMWARADGVLDGAEPAAYATEWVEKTTATKAARAEKARQPTDPATIAQRVATMDAGISEFALWLSDLVRSGLAAAKAQPSSWWENTAKRLVDAKVPGLADSVREISSSINTQGDWVGRTLDALGEWHLSIEAWRGRDALDPDTLAELRVALGWPIGTDEALAAPGLSDQWQVIGVHRTEGRLAEQRTWLLGQRSATIVLMLDFGVGTSPLPVARAIGSTFTNTVHPYPGHAPQRVVLDGDADLGQPIDHLPSGGTFTDARAAFAAQLARNPWTRRAPVVIERAQLTLTHVIDGDGIGVPLAEGAETLTGMALTGGERVRCFGEFDGSAFRPLTIEVDRAEHRLVVL